MAVGAFLMALLNQYATMDNRNYQDKIRREQNIFNKYEAQRAREWNQQMDSTKYQRTVTDMQSAGVNPALAMQGGVSTQATSNAQAQASNPTTPQLDLSQVAQLAMQSKQLKIQEKIADADVRLKNAEAENKETENKYADEFNQLKVEGQKMVNQVNESQVKQINANLEKINAEVEKLKKEAATEEERRLLTISERTLKESMSKLTDEQRKQVVALLPYQQKLMAAQTENQKAQASFALIQAAYQQGLIDNNYIDAIVRETNNKADESESRKISNEIQNNLNTGRWFPDKGFANKAANALLAAAPAVSKVIGALSPIKFALGQ